MNGGSPRCYANAEERAAFLCELQKISKRESRGYLGVAPRGDPLFAEEIQARADGTGFEFRGVALSPTVQQAGPAGVTPSNLLAAAGGAYSPESQTYRGSVVPTWHPNVPSTWTPVRLPMFQHPIGKGFSPEPVGTNRKRLGNRAGPPSSETDITPPLRVRKKTLEGSVDARFSANLSWIEKMEAACRVDEDGGRKMESWLAIQEEVSLDDCM